MKLNVTRSGKMLTDLELAELNKRLSPLDRVEVIRTLEVGERLVWRDKYGDKASSPFALKYDVSDQIEAAEARGFEQREDELERMVDVRCSSCPAKRHFGQCMQDSKELPSGKIPLLVE